MSTPTPTRWRSGHRDATHPAGERGLRDEGAGLEVVGVSKRFGTIAALDGVSLAVPGGRMLGFVASGHVDALRSASQRRCITLRLERAPADWLPPLDGMQLTERRDGELRLRAPRDTDPERVLAAAREAGSVLEFSFGPPTLSELFLELVGR